MSQELIAAVIGLVVGALAAWIKAVLAIREKVNEELRGWYFTSGGLYLSARSRDRYGEMKQLVCAYLDAVDDRARTVPREVYDDLTTTARTFRTALTEDLETRRQRSLWWVVASWRRQHTQHRKWKRLMAKVGEPDRTLRPYPLAQMPLPPVQPPARGDPACGPPHPVGAQYRNGTSWPPPGPSV